MSSGSAETCNRRFPYRLGTLDTNTAPVATAAAATGDAVVVQLDGVTVEYGKNRALKGVSARFARGAVGLLGPNGAGKSTMLKALLGFIKPTEGRMTVLGLDVAERPLEIRSRIGYMPESDSHIPGMNAVSFVGYCGQLAGLPSVDAMQRAHEVLYYVGLGEARYRNVETYSTGMKQRIKLAQALVHDPDLLFLDEPTNGMDPKGRDEMLELVHDLGHNKNVSLILSSHLLPDVEYTCDHVVVMDKGQIAAQGPIADLKGPAGRVFELRVKGDLIAFIDVLRTAGMECHSTDEDVMRVFVPADLAERTVGDIVGPIGSDQRAIFALATKHGVQVRHLRPSVPTLEDVFAKAIGEE
jgi:ABC-2 type transport system ATP-binding protein